jgi:hypothetical protein
VDNGIATIQEDTSSATWRRVPFHFNAVDLILLLQLVSSTSSVLGMFLSVLCLKAVV